LVSKNNEESYKRALSYLTLLKIGKECKVFLSVKDFPFLEAYANRVTNYNTYFIEVLEAKAVPYAEILKKDPFWEEVLGEVGFAYLEDGRFDFGEGKNAVSRAIKFIKELKRRNFFEREEEVLC